MKLRIGKTQQQYRQAKKIIPGGTQLLSKRPELFLPDLWPAYYKWAKGCVVCDLDGKKYIDMSYMGIGACALGYADTDVNRAVKKVIDQGSMATLNCHEEVELAKILCRLHPWAEMARFARGGGEAMAVAVRIARAKTKKDKILFCGYHGWHDWYLAANLANDQALDGHLLSGLNPHGVPRALTGTTIPFNFNDERGFLDAYAKHKDNIGAIVMEPMRNFYPAKNFVKTVNNLKNKHNIPLIMDEVSVGFRLNVGGAHLILGWDADMAVFSKAMSNGYPMAAIIGTKEVMQAAQDTFISSTSWTERIGPTAACATIEKMEKMNLPRHLTEVGNQIKNGWQAAARRHDVEINISGIPPMLHFSFKNKHELILKTLFTQEMLKRGFLATNAYYASYAHKMPHVKKYLEAADEVFALIAAAIKTGKPEKYLQGTVCQAGFQRLN